MKRKKRGWQRMAGAVVAACLLVGTSSITFAADENKSIDDKNLGMQVDIGYGGAYRLGTWTPVRVTLENTGEDFTGRLVVTKDYMTGGNFQTVYEKDIVLPKGSNKRFTLDVPGQMINETVVLQVVNGDGKVVESKPSLSGSPVTEGILIGGITAGKNDLNMFSLVNSPVVGGKITAKALEINELPDRPELLNGLDWLVVNHAPSEQLTPEQMKAVETWVQNGGHLILSGGVGYKGGAGQFAKLSPVAVTGDKELTDLSGLKTYAGLPANATKLSVSTGTPSPDARVLVKAGDVPLIASREVGAGQVMYVAYDLSSEPLASWQGNKELWNKVFSDLGGKYVSDPTHGQPFSDRTQLQYQVSMFKGITPAVSTSVMVFGAYILLVGPLMYLALRRFNKREWAWVLIPGTAAIWALGIYIVGTDQRAGDGITQAIAYVNLEDENTAKVSAGTSFVMNSGGDYKVEFAPGFQTIASRNFGMGDDSTPRVLIEGDQHIVSYDNVEFWSSRSLYTEGVLKDQGSVKSDLHVNKEGQFSGTITNNSKFDFEKAQLMVGDELVEVGDLKAGESVKVEQKLGGKMPSFEGANRELYEVFAPEALNYEYDEYLLERALLGHATQNGRMSTSSVQLYALSKTPLNIYSLVDLTSNKNNHLSLVHQDLNLTYDDGGTEKPLGLVRGEVISRDGSVDYGNGWVNIQVGSATLEYNVKLQPDFVPEKVTTNLDQAAYAMVEKELYNWKTGAWDTISKANTPTMSGEQLALYLSGEGKLLIRFKGNSTTNNHQLMYPKVGVEGKVAR